MAVQPRLVAQPARRKRLLRSYGRIGELAAGGSLYNPFRSVQCGLYFQVRVYVGARVMSTKRTILLADLAIRLSEICHAMERDGDV